MNNGTTETILSDSSQEVYKVTAEELRSFVERVETLDAEKAGYC